MKILIAYDGSTYADIAVEDLRWAGLPQTAQAIVLSVVERSLHQPRSWGMVDTEFPDEWARQAETAGWSAEAICDRLQTEFPQWDLRLELASGKPAAVILDRVKAWPAELVVTGTHGRSKLARLMLGSVALKLTAEAPCSVRVARAGPGERNGPVRLMIGNDGSPEAAAAVNEVCRRKWPAGTEARVVAALETFATVDARLISDVSESFRESDAQERRWLGNVAEQSMLKLEREGLKVSSAIEDGEPKDTLVSEARNWKADAIFVGARGLGRVERLLLGSVSGGVVARAPCTVEVVRHR